MDSRELKVLSLHWGFIPGGVAKYAATFEQVARYAPVSLTSICVKAPSWQLDTKSIDSMDMRYIPVKNRLDPSWIWKLRNVLRNDNPDAIMTFGFNGYFIAGVYRTMFKNIPIFGSWHGDYYPATFMQKIRSPLIEIITRFTLRYVVQEIVTVSDYSKNILLKKSIPESKITVVRNGIPLLQDNMGTNRDKIRAELGIPDKTILIGTACRLEPVKGLKWLLQAIAITKKKRPDLQAVIWGDGPEKPDLQALSRKFGIDDCVTFPGYRKDIDDCLHALDIFVMSSLAENFSIALLEAMRAGRAIVATKVGGNPEALQDGIHGLLVPPQNAEALADAILRVCANESFRHQLASNAFARFKNEFSSEKMVRDTAQWLMESIKLHNNRVNPV